jgi:hypothetical protein
VVGLREKNVVHDRLTRFVRRQERYQPDVSTFGVWVNFFPHFSLLSLCTTTPLFISAAGVSSREKNFQLNSLDQKEAGME